MSSEALVHGEVLPPSAPQPGLAPRQLQAAVAEAAGADRREIAHIADVSESTIKLWRNDPKYRAEVERLKGVAVASLSEPVRRLRENLVEGSRKAVDALVENLGATDRHGNPIHGTRQKAAETLLQYGIDVLKEETPGRKAGDIPASGVVALQVNVSTGDSNEK